MQLYIQYKHFIFLFAVVSFPIGWVVFDFWRFKMPNTFMNSEWFNKAKTGEMFQGRLVWLQTPLTDLSVI